jgi:hypothetical protein
MRHRFALVTLAAVSLAAPSVLAQTAVVAVGPTNEPAAAQKEPADAEGEGEGRLPVAEAERPLTLPRFILNPEGDFALVRVGGGPVALGAPPAPSQLYANLSVAIGFGITDDLTVRALVLPLQLAGPAGTGFHYGELEGDPGPSIGASYRFVRGQVEVAASLDVGIVTQQAVSGATLDPGIPVRIHANKSLRIDTGAYVPIATITPSVRGAKSTTAAGLTIPVSVLYDITEPIHVGVATGFGVGDFNDAGDTSYIPLGFFCGYAVAGKNGPILDIDPSFTFPTLITPGAAKATDTADYVFGLTVGGFFYL